MHRIFHIKAYEKEHGPHFGCNGGFSGYGYGYGEGCNC